MILKYSFQHTSGCGSDEDTVSDGFDDYEDLERHIGEMGFYNEEDSEDDEDNWWISIALLLYFVCTILWTLV